MRRARPKSDLSKGGGCSSSEGNGSIRDLGSRGGSSRGNEAIIESGHNSTLITPKIYGDRRPVTGEVIALLHVKFDRRVINLIEARSRALLKDEIHELMTTTDEGASAIAFIEIKQGGVAVVGDALMIGGEVLGKLAGFDTGHMPNHMNLVIRVNTLEAPPMSIGDEVVIKGSP